MTEGLAKSAVSAQPTAAPIHTTPESIVMGTDVAGVPSGIFMFYDKQPTDSEDTVKQLKTLYDFAKSSTNGSDGDVLMFLRDLDRRMGAPRIGESRMGKAYNYAKLTRQIENLHKQRMSLT